MLTVKWNNTRNDLRIVLNLLEILTLYQGNYVKKVTGNVTLTNNIMQIHTLSKCNVKHIYKNNELTELYVSNS